MHRSHHGAASTASPSPSRGHYASSHSPSRHSSSGPLGSPGFAPSSTHHQQQQQQQQQQGRSGAFGRQAGMTVPDSPMTSPRRGPIVSTASYDPPARASDIPPVLSLCDDTNADMLAAIDSLRPCLHHSRHAPGLWARTTSEATRARSLSAAGAESSGVGGSSAGGGSGGGGGGGSGSGSGGPTTPTPGSSSEAGGGGNGSTASREASNGAGAASGAGAVAGAGAGAGLGAAASAAFGSGVPVAQWRTRERMKTVGVGLVMCLNIGTDPPGTVRVPPCARLESWTDPFAEPPQKALEHIGLALQDQYTQWQPRARYRILMDPTADHVRKLCQSLRRFAKDERVLFHYNGHGVPRPTPNGEVWMFNAHYTQYMPLSVYDLQAWCGQPSIFVFDCSTASVLMPHFSRLSEDSSSTEREPGNEAMAGRRGRTASGQPVNPARREWIVLAACSENDMLPSNPELPADLFTACLTTPIKTALRWLASQNKLVLERCGGSLQRVDMLPGSINNRRTPLGELNWIFTAITDSIAWNVLSKPLFQRLFRQDLLVASLFRNYLLADRVMRSYHCTPVSLPELPMTSTHHLWASWDLAAEMCVAQLPSMLGYTIPPSMPPAGIAAHGFTSNAGAAADAARNDASKKAVAAMATADGRGAVDPSAPGRTQQGRGAGEGAGGGGRRGHGGASSRSGSSRRRGSGQTAANGGGAAGGAATAGAASLSTPKDAAVAFRHSRFFAEQLTAFQVWLPYGGPSVHGPDQLPIVLQVLLSQTHRMRALALLGRFLDMGPWACNLALTVGIFPYILKLLQSPAVELQHILVFVWAKVMAVDHSCQTDLVNNNGHLYFISHVAGGPLLDSVPQAPPAAARSCSPGQYILRCAATLLGDMHTGVSPPPLPPYLTPHGLGPGGIVRAPGDIIAFDQRRQAAFVLCIIMYRHRLGQAACLQQGVHVTVAQHLHDHNPQLRFWLCMALAQLWEGFEDARLTALSDALPNVLVPLLLSDTDVCVRAAAALALGALLRGDDHHAAGDKEDGDYAWGFSTDAGALPHAAGPPASAPASSPTPTNPNVLLEGYVTAAWHMALLPKAGARQRPRRASAPKPIDSTTSSPHRSFRGERVAEAADPPQGEEREPGATSASSSRSHSHSHSRSNSSGMAAGDASWNTSGSGGGGNASAPRSPRNGRSLSEASVGSGSTTGLSLFPRCSQYALPARPPSRAMMELAIAVCTCVSAADASPMVRREAILALARLVVQPRHAKALRIVAAAAMVRRNAVRQASSGVGIVKGGSGGGGSGGGAKAGSSRGGGPSASASSRALLQRSTDLGHSSSRALELDRERGLMMMSPGGGGDMDDAMGAVLAIGGSLEDVSELADRGGSSSSLTGRVTTTPASSSGPARPSMRPGLSRNASFLQAGRESARSLHSAAVAGARQRAGSEGRLDAGTKGHQGGGVSAMAAAAASDLTSYLATPPPRSVIAAAASSSSAGGAGGARLTGDSVIAGLPDNEVLQRIVRDSADAMLRLVVGDLGERGALYLKVWRTIQQLQRDPFPAVARMARILVLRIRSQLMSAAAQVESGGPAPGSVDGNDAATRRERGVSTTSTASTRSSTRRRRGGSGAASGGGGGGRDDGGGGGGGSGGRSRRRPDSLPHRRSHRRSRGGSGLVSSHASSNLAALQERSHGDDGGSASDSGAGGASGDGGNGGGGSGNSKSVLATAPLHKLGLKSTLLDWGIQKFRRRLLSADGETGGEDDLSQSAVDRSERQRRVERVLRGGLALAVTAEPDPNALLATAVAQATSSARNAAVASAATLGLGMPSLVDEANGSGGGRNGAASALLWSRRTNGGGLGASGDLEDGGGGDDAGPYGTSTSDAPALGSLRAGSPAMMADGDRLWHESTEHGESMAGGGAGAGAGAGVGGGGIGASGASSAAAAATNGAFAPGRAGAPQPAPPRTTVSLLAQLSSNDVKEAFASQRKLGQKSIFDNEAAMTSMLLFHPYEMSLVVADDSDGLSFWNYEQGTRTKKFHNSKGSKSRVTAMDWINEFDDCQLLTGADDGLVRVWHGFLEQDASHRLVTAFNALPELVSGGSGPGLVMQWQPGPQHLVVGGNSNMLRVWDLERERCISRCTTGAGDAFVTCMTSGWPGSDRGLVVLGCSNGAIHIVDPRVHYRATEYDVRQSIHPPPLSDACAPAHCVQKLHEHKNWLVQVDTQRSGSGTAVYSGSISGSVRVWDVRRAGSITTIKAHNSAMTSMVVHDYAPVLATGSKDQHIKLWSTRTGEPLGVIRYHQGFLGQRIGPVACLAFHRHRIFLGIGATDSIVSIYTGHN